MIKDINKPTKVNYKWRLHTSAKAAGLAKPFLLGLSHNGKISITKFLDPDHGPESRSPSTSVASYTGHPSKKFHQNPSTTFDISR